ncbi:MAG: carboxypeptidase regulatory-like domain-containing protein [Candidatus Scalindua sp. AMX11]|nr:MAG: carboxypeptidase regulatory-like domain-containing protein [Candidatus Scalindua sp.]NOG85133.1 carboxypeptidase regulatory-like domain-containing protein [Planctomycetota bacterium]RZV67661.1 MAG: carboxypeptidase regulatory-like domain-containing protein [Candidatus Scalindua sp. SCAELEC01]TDE63713.1 MAG: carboxypeptidase regulatory-like domain-containing protein [Candidatus Scalindua sp. AMX11]GJQ57206.1 MAG: hypothetical protein SCALA701_00070 [Candidatus Scalindua sp.]
MTYKKIFIILFLIISCLTTFGRTAFSQQGTLKGQIVDGFDNVLKDVLITIKTTMETTKSDENGQYEIRFNPGKIDISFKKEGYSIRKFTFNIHEASEIPMQKLNLWKLPDTGGMFLVKMDDYKSIEYGEFFSERNDESICFFTKGKPTRIICPDESLEEGKVKMMLLDYSKDNPLVVGKKLYKIKEKDLIGSIKYKPREWEFDDLEDQYVKISNKVGLRYVDLEPGKYFYCIGEITMRSKIGYGYMFEVTTSGLSNKEEK